MRLFIKLFILLLALGYMIFVIVKFSLHEYMEQCQSVNVVIADSAQATLITEVDIHKMLRQNSMHPLGRTLKNEDLLKIEKFLMKEPFIRQARAFINPGNEVRIHISQRLPLLRIMSDNGEDYYIDEKGYRMAPRGYEADLAIVTGAANEAFVKKNLVALGTILRNDEFWNSQIQQIHVQPNHEVDLVMRVGDQIVHLGRAEEYQRKLRNLRAFYDQVLPQVGWYRYKEISVAFENQVIGIK